MITQATPRQVVAPMPQLTSLDAVFDIAPGIALRWIDSILSRAAKDLSPQEVIYLLRSRAALAGTLPMDQRRALEAPHPVCEGLARSGVRQTVQQERARAIAESKARYASPLAPNRMLDELWNAAFAPTNLMGTLASSAQMLDSLYHSLPATMHVHLQGGTWELYDANKSARRHAFGKYDKAKFPVRMQLRARGAKMSWLTAFRSTPKGMVAAVPGATSVPQALKLAAASRLKLISNAAYGALPLRGVLGSNAVGLAISMGPQAFVDARASGLFSDPTNKSAWKEFAAVSAGSQSGNLAGVVGGLVVGGALVLAASTFGVGIAAPVVILAAFAGAVGGQATFNAWGLNEKAEEAAAHWLLGR
jgi:hypothetical protein